MTSLLPRLCEITRRALNLLSSPSFMVTSFITSFMAVTLTITLALTVAGCMESEGSPDEGGEAAPYIPGPSMVAPIPEPYQAPSDMVEGGDELSGGWSSGGSMVDDPFAGESVMAGTELSVVEEAGTEMEREAGRETGPEGGAETGPEAGAETGPETEAGMGAGTAGEMTPAPSNEFPDYAVEMLELVNEFRAQGGTCGGQALPSAPPLMLNSSLNLAAYLHAEDMALNNYFDHTSQDGRSPWDRIGETGYQGRAFGENIAAGNGSAVSTFEQWRSSPGHCSNMLNGNFTELGVGYFNHSNSRFRHYWVQKFARPR